MNPGSRSLSAAVVENDNLPIMMRKSNHYDKFQHQEFLLLVLSLICRPYHALLYYILATRNYFFIKQFYQAFYKQTLSILSIYIILLR